MAEGVAPGRPGLRAGQAPGRGRGPGRVFTAAGFEWRQPGCSMCLGTNGDIAAPGERFASTSNRNFMGRQGPGARTHLLSPAMAAAAAVTGHFADVRTLMAGRTERWKPSASLDAVAVPLPLPNIDTDQIIPARFLSSPRESTTASSCSTTRACAAGRHAGPGIPAEPAGMAAGAHHRRRAQFRLRLLARERGLGAVRRRLPLRHRAQLRRHLPYNGIKNGLLPVVLPAEAWRDLTAQLEAEPGAQVAGRPALADRDRARWHGPSLRDRSLRQALPAAGPRRFRPDRDLRGRDRRLRAPHGRENRP